MSKQEQFKEKVFGIAKDNNEDPEKVWSYCEITRGQVIDGIEGTPSFILFHYESSTFMARDITTAFKEVYLT